MTRCAGALVAFGIAACSPDGPGPEPQASLKWRNADVRGESVPAVGSTAVYHLEQETHILAAVRKLDGSLLWRVTLPVTDPAHDGYGLALVSGVLVVGDLDLFGIDPQNGSVLWRYRPSVGANPGFGILAARDGVVYCGSTSGHVFAVDAVTGQERWATPAMPTTSSIYDPIVVGGVVYASYTNFDGANGVRARGGVVAVDAATGSVLWKAAAPVRNEAASSENFDAVAVIGSRVYFGSPEGVHVVDLATGTFVASMDAAFFGDAPLTPHRPVAVDGVLLVASGQPPHVTAVDPSTLRRLWQLPTASSVSGMSGAAGTVYVPQFGELAAVDINTGVRRWTFDPRSVGNANEAFLAAPAIDGDLIFVPGSKSVYAFVR